MTICTGALGQNNTGQARKHKHDEEVKRVGIRGRNNMERKNQSYTPHNSYAHVQHARMARVQANIQTKIDVFCFIKCLLAILCVAHCVFNGLFRL